MTDKCIICGNDKLIKFEAEFAPFLVERMFDNNNVRTDLLYCPECNFYYSSYRPNEEEMSKLYSNYRDNEYQKQREKHEPLYTEKFNAELGFAEEEIYRRNRNLTKLVEKHIDISKIENLLDFGGDYGQYIPAVFNNANKYVYDVSGVEPIKDVKSIKDINALKNTNWDFIMCCHVLEHMSYPKVILNQILDIMPDNSFLYLELPFEDFIEHSSCPRINEHINFFRTESTQLLFENKRFVILENKYKDVYGDNGQVIAKYIQCLVKKLDENEDTALYWVPSYLENKVEQNGKLLMQCEKLLIQIKQNFDKPTFLQQIFSVRNEGKHKVIRILGLKLKLKRKKK